MEVTDITDTCMQTGFKRMKKGRAPGIDEMRVEMVMAAVESGIRWTKSLLNICVRQGKVPEEWRINYPQYGRGREICKTQGIPRHHTSKSHDEAAREDPGWEDSKESRARTG